MKIGSMFSDVFKSLFRRPATQSYPLERAPSPPRLRSKLLYDPSQCTGCQLCIKDCPSDAIELITLDRVNKRFVMRYHVDRCTFCDQCVVTCRFKCLSMSNEDWELASLHKEPFTVDYGKDEDIEFLLAKESGAVPEVPGER